MEQFDGRHSTRATEIERGVGRYLRSLNFFYVPELTLPDKRRADMVALGPKGQIWIIEIKSSIEDFRADHKCCLLYTSPSPRDLSTSRMPSSA